MKDISLAEDIMTAAAKLREIVKQGGGKVTPLVSLSRRATIDETSTATDYAEVMGEAQLLRGTKMMNHAKAMEFCVLKECFVAEHARVGGAVQAERCSFSGTSDVRGAARLRDSLIRDNTMVLEESEVYRSNLGANTRVKGEARLWNVITGRGSNRETFLIEGEAVLNFPVQYELAPGTWIHEGEWFRPPKVIDTPLFTMVEGVNDRVQIGCLNHSISYWYKHGLQVLLDYGLYQDLYPVFKESLDEMQAFKSKFKSPKVRRKKK